jgi:hypothetical protein
LSSKASTSVIIGLVGFTAGGRSNSMSIDKDHVKTQDELNEPAPMDVVEERVDAEMKELEDKAKKDVADGLEKQDDG